MAQDNNHSDIKRELQGILDEIENNAKANANREECPNLRRHLWNTAFHRLLRLDGKQLMYLHDELRFQIKARAHEALAIQNHPIAETAKLILNFIEQVEYWGIDYDDIDEDNSPAIVIECWRNQYEENDDENNDENESRPAIEQL